MRAAYGKDVDVHSEILHLWRIDSGAQDVFCIGGDAPLSMAYPGAVSLWRTDGRVMCCIDVPTLCYCVHGVMPGVPLFQVNVRFRSSPYIVGEMGIGLAEGQRYRGWLRLLHEAVVPSSTTEDWCFRC